jgi:hypothetical protein
VKRRQECSPRRKPWVYATRKESPNGAKDSASYVGQYPAAYDFQHASRLALIKPEFRDDLFAYLGGIIREMRGTALIINGAADHVHVLVRIRPADPFGCGNRSGDQSEFLGMGSCEMEPKFRLANWIRRIQRQRIERRGRNQIYCQSRRTSQKAFVSGRAFGVPQEEQCSLRCEISLGLVSAARSGLHTVRMTPHGWRRGLHSYAASRLEHRQSRNTVRCRTISPLRP